MNDSESEATMASHVMLLGGGWTQRRQVAENSDLVATAEIDRVGRNETSHLRVLDPSTGEPTNVVVAWQHVAVADVVGSGHREASETSAGQYR